MSRATFLVTLAFGVLNVVNALHKGGDFTVFLEGGSRFIDGSSLYEGSSPGDGVIGPPFQNLFFAPFSWLATWSETASRLVWHGVNVVAMVVGAGWWADAIEPRASTGGDTGAHRASRRPSPLMLWSLAAIAVPTQTSFEHQNMSPLLLAVMGWAARMWRVGRLDAAAVALGVAAALKAFPALIIVFLLAGRQVRTAAVATSTAVACTALALARYGAGGANVMVEWMAINREGNWPLRPQNQSLYAALGRVWPEAAAWAFPLAALLLLAIVLLSAARLRFSGRQISGLAYALAAAVVLSPIAWDHYWVLMYPALVAVGSGGREGAGAVRLATFATAAMLISGAPPFLLPHLFHLARACSASTLAALVLLGHLTWALQVREAPAGAAHLRAQ